MVVLAKRNYLTNKIGEFNGKQINIFDLVKDGNNKKNMKKKTECNMYQDSDIYLG